MKFIKLKSLIISCAVCLLPIVFGMILWNRLPDMMAVHFNVYNETDGFASKGFVVFGLPIIMAVLQMICCFINDLNASRHGERRKFEAVTKSIVPVLTVALQSMTLCFAMGYDMDIRRIVACIVGVILIAIGNYQPKFDRIKDYDGNTEKAKKIHRFIGIATVVMGLLFLVSTLFVPTATLVCLFLLVPYALVCALYGLKVGSSK